MITKKISGGWRIKWRWAAATGIHGMMINNKTTKHLTTVIIWQRLESKATP
jgi:hypothetical protein